MADPADLTADELTRIGANLRARFVGREYPGVTGVSVGIAAKGGAPDAGRRWAVCFHVVRKYTPRARAQRLPTEVAVRVKRGRGFVSLTLPTDVIDMSGVAPSGLALRTPRLDPTRSGNVTAGLVVEWQLRDGSAVIAHTGLVSVGHGCDFPQDLGPFGLFVYHEGGDALAGLLLARADPADGIDAALIDVSGLIAVNPADLRPVAPFDTLVAAVGREGSTLRPDADPDDPFTFTVQSTVYTDFIPGLGVMTDIVRVHAPFRGTFEHGTSGSVWLLPDDDGEPRAAFIQLAADLATFTTGYGQVIESRGLAWAIETLAAQPNVIPESIRAAGGF